MINNILKNIISEALAKQKLNALNEIKKTETKNKRLINGQKILLNLYDDLLEAIFNGNDKIVTEDNNKTVSEDDNTIVTEDNNKTMSKDDNKIVIEYNNSDDDDNNDDNNNNDNNDEITVKKINNDLKKIDETYSFEEQINLFREIDVSILSDY